MYIIIVMIINSIFLLANKVRIPKTYPNAESMIRVLLISVKKSMWWSAILNNNKLIILYYDIKNKL